MNYWPRWINAIRKRTATLSLAEMGAYDRLLDHYYAEEKPLPSDLDECCRIVAALTKEERKAVEKVLARFFVPCDAGLRNERADAEIMLALPKIAAAKANGAKGGRKPGSQKEPSGFPVGCQWKPDDDPTGLAPHLKSKKYKTGVGQERDPPELQDLENFTPTPAGAACKAMRLAGILGTNPSHPDLLRLLAAGVTAQELGDTASVAVSKGKVSFAYVLATVENRRIEAAAKSAVPAAVAGPGPTIASDAAERTAEMLRQQANRGHSKPPVELRARIVGASQDAA